MPAAQPHSLRQWSTQTVAPAQRLDYWVSAVCEGFLEMDVARVHGGGFDGELTSAPLGPVGLNRVRGSAQQVYRRPSAIARSPAHYLYLLCKTDTAWTAQQQGRGARLLPGDLVLVDSRRCYEFHFPQCADTLSLQLPTAWAEAWLPDTDAVTATRIDGRQGWGQALGSFVRQLQPELAAAPPLPAPLLADQLGALLALVAADLAPASAAPPDASRQAQAALRHQVLQAVAQRHAEPGLTAAEVAQALGVSPRSLHRCLAGSGQTFAQALQAQRLAAARRLLADRRFDRLSLAELGRRVGLLDPSHFSRLCRHHLGATPSALRRQR